MGFDEMYDEMLHNEFGSGAAGAAAGVSATAAGPVDADWRTAVPDGACVGSSGEPGRVVQPAVVAPGPGVRAPLDAASLVGSVSAVRGVQTARTPASGPLHRAFRTRGLHVAREAPVGVEGPRGLSRYRNAALVGAGGLTCAAIGAFMGGLGGYFTVDPAAAHPLTSSTSAQSQPVASAVEQGYRTALGGRGSTDGVNGSFSSVSGGLAQGDPLQWLTTSGSDDVAMPGSPATLGGPPGLGGAGSGSGSGGLGLGCTTQSDLGVGCVLSSITSVLGDLGATAGSDPTPTLDALFPGLSGVVSDVTGTLSDLGALLPTSSLPAAALPTSVLDELGLGTIVTPVTGAGSGLDSLASPAGLSSIGLGDLGTLPASVAGSLDPIVIGILAAAGGGTGSGSGSLGSLGSLGPAGASGSTGVTGGRGSSSSNLPVTSALGAVTAPASSTVSSSTTTTTTTTSASTTTSTEPSGSTSSGTTLTVPLPSLPLPGAPPVSAGGDSVGVNSSGSGSGLSLSLP